LGADYSIKNIRGYAPLQQDELLSNAFFENAAMFLDEAKIDFNCDMTGSTDMGDLGRIIPVIQPTIGGFVGALHSKEFLISDKEFVYVTASKILACTVYDLIKDNAKLADKIKNEFKISIN